MRWRKPPKDARYPDSPPGTMPPVVDHVPPRPNELRPPPLDTIAECRCDPITPSTYRLSTTPADSWASTFGFHSADDDPRRVTTCTTPLIASEPYSAEPCGPRMISIRSMLYGSTANSRYGLASSTPSTYVFR